MFCTYILHFHSKILVSIQVYDIDLYHTISPSRIQEAEIHLTHTTQHFHMLPTKVNKGTHIHNTTVCHYLHTSVSLKRQIRHKSLSRLTKKNSSPYKVVKFRTATFLHLSKVDTEIRWHTRP